MAKGNRGGKRSTGGSSVKQVIIDFGNSAGTKIYREENGTVYSIGVGNSIDKAYTIDMKSLIANANKQGYKIQTFTNSEYKKWLANYNKKRKQTNDQITKILSSNKKSVNRHRANWSAMS